MANRRAVSYAGNQLRASDGYVLVFGRGIAAVPAILSIRCDRHEHEARVFVMKLLVPELVVREISGWKALDENIGRPRQLAKHEPAVGGFEIERDAALVRIERQPVQALTAAMMLVERWPPTRPI